jgi:hypothetical protein
MNNKIEELLKESTHDIMGVKQVDQKQFAELIIKECASVAHFVKEHAASYVDPEEVILKHFKVEK